MQTCDNLEQLKQQIAEHEAVLVYFSGQNCGVCQVLRPKIEAMVEATFPALTLLEVESAKHPAMAAQLQVMSVPTVVVFFTGQEGYRFSRSFGINELAEAIRRPYEMLFS